jgi:hypothetical protein
MFTDPYELRADRYNEFFQNILVCMPGILDDEEVSRVVGCVNYAARKAFGGKVDHYELAAVSRQKPETSINVKMIAYPPVWKDALTSKDLNEFVYDVETFLREGTPVRKTNSHGPAGTRLVEGFGEGAGIVMVWCEAWHHDVEVYVDGELVYHKTFRAPDSEVNTKAVDALSQFLLVLQAHR